MLDVGCGTGVLAVQLAARGLSVVGADPAAASLAFARLKPAAERVRWVDGAAAELGSLLAGLDVELAVMTGNVAQVFTEDAEWRRVLGSLARLVRPGGHLVFESRRPEARAWEQWAHRAPEVRDVPGLGRVEQRFVLTDVTLPLVSFRFTYRFEDGAVVSSDSTLVFRSRERLVDDVAAAGFEDIEVRDAPDRSGLEYVVVARQAASAA